MHNAPPPPSICTTLLWLRLQDACPPTPTLSTAPPCWGFPVQNYLKNNNLNLESLSVPQSLSCQSISLHCGTDHSCSKFKSSNHRTASWPRQPSVWLDAEEWRASWFKLAQSHQVSHGDFIPWQLQDIKMLGCGGCPISSSKFCTDVSVQLMQTLDNRFDSFIAATIDFREEFWADTAAWHYSRVIQQIRLGIKHWQGVRGINSAALSSLFSGISVRNVKMASEAILFWKIPKRSG
jgi:hypothetical protein